MMNTGVTNTDIRQAISMMLLSEDLEISSLYLMVPSVVCPTTDMLSPLLY